MDDNKTATMDIFDFLSCKQKHKRGLHCVKVRKTSRPFIFWRLRPLQRVWLVKYLFPQFPAQQCHSTNCRCTETQEKFPSSCGLCPKLSQLPRNILVHNPSVWFSSFLKFYTWYKDFVTVPSHGIRQTVLIFSSNVLQEWISFTKYQTIPSMCVHEQSVIFW